MRRPLLAALLTGLVWCGLAAAAWAHAALTASVPADGAVVEGPPQTFSLSFSEPVSPLVLKLVRPDGQAGDLDRFVLRDRTLEIAAPADLAPGTHVLTWRVVSGDGHPVAGSTVFSIGAPSAARPLAGENLDRPVQAALWTARIILYAGLFIGIGGVFAGRWLTPSAKGEPRIVPAALLAGLLGTIASAGFHGLDVLGRPFASLPDPAVWRAGLSTSFGATVLVLSVAFLLAFAARRLSSRTAGKAASATALIAAGAALALSGHASAADPQWLTRPAVFLHAATIAIWVGALLPLAWALRHDPPAGQAALRRFSRAIPFAVAILVLAGILLAAVQVREPAALFSTAYGTVLLVKLAFLLPLFGLVAVNRWVLTKPAAAGEAAATGRLVRAITVETLLVLAIFAAAAAWRFTPPPRALAAAPPLRTHIHAEKAMAQVTVSPGRAGPVDLSAVLLAPDRAPLKARDVTFVLSSAQAGIEAMRRKAVPGEGGSWRAEGVVLPLAGTWTLRIDALVGDFDLVRLQGEVVIKP